MKRIESVYTVLGLLIGVAGIAIAIYATIDQKSHEDELVQNRQSSQHAAQLVEQLNVVRGKFELLQVLCHKKGVSQEDRLQAAIQLRDVMDNLVANSSKLSGLGKSVYHEFKCFVSYNASILEQNNVCLLPRKDPKNCLTLIASVRSDGCYKAYANSTLKKVNERMDRWGWCLTEKIYRITKKKYGIDISQKQTSTPLFVNHDHIHVYRV